MHRVSLRIASALLALSATVADALADDADTCRKADGDDSIAACSHFIARYSRDGNARYNRAIAFTRKGEYDRALADFDEALRINPKNALAYIQRSFVYNVKGEHDRAIADLDQAIRFDPRNANAYGNRAGAYASKGDHGRALADYDQAIRLDPKLAKAYAGRGSVHEHIGDYNRAIADYDHAISLEPKYAFAFNGRGNAYGRKGDYDRAIASYDQAIALNARYAAAMVNLAEIYLAKGDYDRAIADFDQAIRIDPTLALAYASRCGAYNFKGEYDRGIADCDDAIRLDPNLPNPYSHRGFAYGRKGDFARAMADLNKALALDPKYARGYGNRAAIYELQGDLARAAADYEEALKLNPALPDVRASRDRLRTVLAARAATAGPEAGAAGQDSRAQDRKTQDRTAHDPLARGAERRVALVIGNSAYRSVAFLPNPRRDASAVADALRQTGFQDVELATDLDRDGIVKALRSFRDKADNADWALIYFAGHGVEIERVNYLIPTDARLLDDRDVKTETISYEEMLSAVSGARMLRIVVLDACRVNPFNDRMRRTFASRGATDRGLAPPPEENPGTLVVYSAKDGEVAADDAGGANSPFARAFVAELKVPGREIRRLFDFVRDDVMDATDNRQQPFTYGSLPGRKDFFFVAGK